MRWALFDAAAHASRHPLFQARYQRIKHQAGRQRGPKVGHVDLARRLTEAIWHMLTTNQPDKPFAPADAPTL